MKPIKTIILSIGVCAIMLTTACETNDNSANENNKDDSSTSKTTTLSKQEESIPVADKYIAITFDDGPNITTTCEIIDLFDQYNANATFFLIGNNINDTSAESVKKAYNSGHEIANHSLTHGYLNNMTADEIINEIDTTNQMIYDIIGEYPKFFRPPYIAVSDLMFENIDMPFVCGYGCNDWDSSVDVQKRIDTVLEQAHDGAIILLHDSYGNSKTVEALNTIIPELQSQGYALVTLSQLFEVKGITPIEDNVLYSFVEQTGMYS